MIVAGTIVVNSSFDMLREIDLTKLNDYQSLTTLIAANGISGALIICFGINIMCNALLADVFK